MVYLPVNVQGWIQTSTGIKFFPLEPQIEDIYIQDIAHALSNLCRFGGHCSEFYSVAQHSVEVAQIVPKEYALWGLLHDASEAYLVDIPRPLKPFLKEYLTFESQLMYCICKKFNLPLECPKSVEIADDIVLATETRDLMKSAHITWETYLPEGESLLTHSIIPLTPKESYKLFMAMFSNTVFKGKI